MDLSSECIFITIYDSIISKFQKLITAVKGLRKIFLQYVMVFNQTIGCIKKILPTLITATTLGTENSNKPFEEN